MSSSGPTIETVSRRRVIPPAEVARETQSGMPECWAYLEALRPEDWSEHIVYLYREEPKTTSYSGAPAAYLDKFVGAIEIRPGYSVPMDDAGAIQQAVREKFGGRVFRMIVKKGHQRVTECRFTNESPAKFPEAQNAPTYAAPVAPTSDANVIASKAIDAVSQQPQEVMNIAISALKASAEMIAQSARQQNPPAPLAVPAVDEFERAMRQAVLAKVLAPAPDPFELLVKLKQLESPANANPLVDKLMNAAVDRFMNPAAPTITGKTTLLDLGREVIPLVATTARDAIHEWRMGVEAQVRGVELTRGVNPPPVHPIANAPAAPQPSSPPPAAMASAPPGVPPAPEQPSTDPPFEWLAIKIVEILREPSYTIDETVEETLSFLYRAHAPMVALLLDPPKLNPQLPAGEQGLLTLFQYHPVLKQVPANARLFDFIHKFVAEAQAAEREAHRPAGPIPVPNPAPTAAPVTPVVDSTTA